MAIIFVAKDGNDGNSGTSYALAKLTIGAAITAATSGDTIKVAPGVYNEAVTTGAKNLTFQADGYVILDGTNTLTNGFTNTGASSVTMTVNDFIIIRFTNGIGTATNSTDTTNLNRCRIHSCTTGVNHTVGTFDLHNCLIYDCTTGINSGSVQNISVQHCTISNTTTGFTRSGNNTTTNKHNIFAYNTRHISWTAVGGTINSDYNCIDFGSGDTRWSSTIDTTLSGWQSTSGKDANSLSQTPGFLDITQRLYTLHTSSSLLEMIDEPGVGLGVGYTTRGYVGMSVNDPDGHWADRILSNTEVNASNNIQLAGASTNGYARTPIIDLGSQRRIGKINIVTNLINSMYPTDVPDYSTADTQPKRITLRYRTSNSSFLDGDASPSWVEIEPNQDVNTQGRYLQVEITLRNNGV